MKKVRTKKQLQPLLDTATAALQQLLGSTPGTDPIDPNPQFPFEMGRLDIGKLKTVLRLFKFYGIVE
jgi:hypothetical protein